MTLYWPIRPMSGISRRAVIMQLRRSRTESSLALRWREMDSNYRFRARMGTLLSLRSLSVPLNCSPSAGGTRLREGLKVRIWIPPAESPRLRGFRPPMARSRLFARVRAERAADRASAGPGLRSEHAMKPISRAAFAQCQSSISVGSQSQCRATYNLMIISFTAWNSMIMRFAKRTGTILMIVPARVTRGAPSESWQTLQQGRLGRPPR
jgi:hypothetical protein